MQDVTILKRSQNGDASGVWLRKFCCCMFLLIYSYKARLKHKIFLFDWFSHILVDENKEKKIDEEKID